ncbi:MAG: Inner membrane protein YnjF [Candidatus Anoxychlamydiales bacterium]|nr:Inner membrane protein YnjF [Candidatus Anoxychlamydiales bacterium]
MLDTSFRSFYQKVLIEPFIKFAIFKKIHPNFLTILAMITGIIASFFIAINIKYLAISLLLLSGYLDTLDGSIARKYFKTSNFGSVLDVFSDRVVEFSIMLSLYLLDPTRAFFILIMLGSAYLCITSFLVVGIFFENKTQKSFHYSPGIMERTETFIFFFLMIIFPKYFIYLSLLFSFLVVYTALRRIFDFLKKSKLEKIL